MFDFDVLGISALDEDHQPAAPPLGIATLTLNVPITDVPRGPALTLAPETTVAAALEAMRRRSRAAVVVVQGHRPQGVVTDRDIIAHVRDDRGEAPIETIMAACGSPLRLSDTVGSALLRMCTLRQWHLPLVSDDGLMIGAIDVTDILLWLRDHMTMMSVDRALE